MITIKPIGMPKNIPSNLSNIPPWPGKKFPLSLILAFLFKYEKNKSPIWQAIDVTAPTIKIIMLKVSVKKNVEMLKVILDKAKEPIDPEIVLLGLIFESFGPLRVFPVIYPPTSEKIHAIRRYNKNNL